MSSLTSGTATPNPLSISGSVDSRSLFSALSRIADINGEYPNSGSVSLSFDRPNPLLPITQPKPVDYVLPTNRRINTGPINPRSLYDSLTKLADTIETGTLIQPEAVDVEPEFNTEIPIPVDIDPEPQLDPMPTEPEEEFFEISEDEEHQKTHQKHHH